MARTTDAIVNFVLNFLVGYAAGAVLRDRRTALKAGVALGVIGAIASFALSEHSEDAVEIQVENDGG